LPRRRRERLACISQCASTAWDHLGRRIPCEPQLRRPPAINFNFLSSPPDAEQTVRAVRIARAIMTAPAMAPFQVSEVVPGADLTTDEEILLLRL
jgi:hypothetical protein